MNTTTFPLRGLYWKEIRQIVPLVLMLVGVSLLLALIWTVLQTTTQSMATFGPFIPLILPALYAAGAGAILVGQEKETRTLLWFSSLPISPRQIVQVKFVVALGGLVVMWVCSIVVGGLVGISGSRQTAFMLTPGDEGFANTLFWILHSVFVMCCGFFTTWKLKNTFASLVALIPLAVIPYLIVQVGYSLVGGNRFISIEESARVWAIVTAVAIPIIAWIAYQAAIAHLAPAGAEADERGPAQWLAAWRPANSVPIPESPFRLSLSSLVWQSIHQNMLTLIGLFALMSLGTLSTVLFSSNALQNEYGGFVVGGMVAGLLAVSWLGVFVFNGDGTATRMRFLADRGVSPTLAWLGRHLIGLSMIATLTLFYALGSYWFIHTDSIDHEREPLVLSMVTFGFVAFAVYSISQWTSQAIRILAASAFVAPVFSLAAIVWLGYSATDLEAPLALIVLTAAIPMLATSLMMRRFMDDNTKWPIWTTGIVTAGLLYLLPTIPMILEVRNFPHIPGEVRARLVAEAMQIPSPGSPPQQMTLATPAQDGILDSYSLTQAQAIEYLDSQDNSPSQQLSLGDMSVTSQVPLQYDHYAFHIGLESAEYAMLLFTQNPQDETTRQSLAEWITAFSVMAARLRLSDRWLDQQAADMAEIWLTQTLSEPALESSLDQDFAKTALGVIADSDARTAHRRRAVLASWRDDQLLLKSDEQLEDRYSFGGLDKSSWFNWLRHTKRSAVESKAIDRLVAATLALIDAGASGEDTEPQRRELWLLIVGPTFPFELGPYSDSQRVSGSPSDAVLYEMNWQLPACQWYAPWEADAQQLSRQRGQ